MLYIKVQFYCMCVKKHVFVALGEAATDLRNCLSGLRLSG